MPEGDRATLSLVHRVRRPTAPPSDEGGRPPLLVLLHGIGSNELAMAGLSGAFDPRFIVVSARAPIELEPFAFAWFPMAFMPDGPEIDGEDLKPSPRTTRILPGCTSPGSARVGCSRSRRC